MKANLDKSTAQNVVELIDKLRKQRNRLKEWESSLYEVAVRELEGKNENQAE